MATKKSSPPPSAPARTMSSTTATSRTEVAPRKGGNGGGALALPDDLAAELTADSGKGFEEATRDAYAIPFLVLLQDLSPQTKKKMPGYIEGARPGQVYQSVSQELYDQCRVIPCHFSQVFIEWVPRGKGGGFVAAYDPITGAHKVTTAVRDGGIVTLPNGNEIYDTRQHFVLVVKDDGSAAPALIALKSTGLKVSRRWMAQMHAAVIEVNNRIIAPPMFAWSYRLSSEEEANEKGSWYTWSITDRTRVTDIELYRQAKMFGASMRQGNVKVNYDEMQTQTVDDFKDRGPAPQDIDDNEIAE